MDKLIKIVLITLVGISLSACVSQNYEDDTPVVENSATQNEIAMTRISLGLGYLKMGNTQQAKLNLEKAKRAAPKLIQVHSAFAHYYETVGEPELAKKSYKEALTIQSDDADTLNNYGVFLCRQEQYDEAEIQINKAIAVPSYILVAKSYENLALCQLKAMRFAKAESYFEKAILHSPSSATILLHMVQLQYAKRSYKTAELYLGRYEKATRRFSSHALALAFKVYQKQYKRSTAKNYASMLVSMFPNSYEAKQYILNGLHNIEADELALSYKTAQLGKNAESKTAKKRVVLLSPNSKSVTKDSSSNKTGLVKNAVKEQSKPIAKPNPDAVKVDKQSQSIVAKSTKNKQTKKSDNKSKLKNTVSMTVPVHVVKKGDSLFSISKKYNIYMKTLLKWNNLKKSHLLHIGDVIQLADPRKASKS